MGKFMVWLDDESIDASQIRACLKDNLLKERSIDVEKLLDGAVYVPIVANKVWKEQKKIDNKIMKIRSLKVKIKPPKATFHEIKEDKDLECYPTSAYSIKDYLNMNLNQIKKALKMDFIEAIR